MHSCFIIRDYLFVVFGTRTDAEYIDLKAPHEFKPLQVEGTLNFRNAIILVNEEKVRFFADIDQGRRVNASKDSLLDKHLMLREIEIEWGK